MIEAALQLRTMSSQEARWDRKTALVLDDTMNARSLVKVAAGPAKMENGVTFVHRP
jgi:hypothetical protein